MPIHLTIAQRARLLIAAYDAIQDAKKQAEYAREDAGDHGPDSFPPEIVTAYRLLAEDAEANIRAAEEAYGNARQEFMDLMPKD